MEFDKYRPGTFCWAELATTDQQGAKNFYAQLFGWESQDNPISEDSFYTILKINGKDVGALYTLDKDQRESGVPPHWNLYVAVDSVAKYAKAIEKAGGKAIVGPLDVFDLGKMLVVQDPTGAVFALWEPVKFIGAALAYQPRTMCWFELMTRDTAGAQKFYSQVFGWKAVAKENSQPPYSIFYLGKAAPENTVGGLFELTKEHGDAPPNWMVYWGVDDCDQTVEKAKSLGATIHIPPTDIPDEGRFAMIQDPQGAVFCVIRHKSFG